MVKNAEVSKYTELTGMLLIEIAAIRHMGNTWEAPVVLDCTHLNI